MRRNWYHSIVAVALIALLAEVSWAQEKPTPGFNNKIPDSVLTPDTVKTKLGTLKFFDGIPDEKAAAALFAHAALNGVLEGEEQSEAASCSEIRLREWRELLSFGQPRDGDGGMQLSPDERRPPVTVEYIGRHAEPISKALVKQVCLA